MAQPPETKPTRPGTKPFRINQHQLETYFAGSDDVIIDSHQLGDAQMKLVVAYCSGMVDTQIIHDIILPEMKRTYEITQFIHKSDIEKILTCNGTTWTLMMRSMERS